MLEQEVRAAIESSGMLDRGDTVVVGVSGGPDSVALLGVLVSLAPQYGYRLHVAHLDHRLRGQASELDAEFVRDLANDLGVPVTIEARDVPALARRQGLGVEEAARLARYQFLAEVVERLDASGVALGHTADDQVETVVLHWLRGAGLVGLRGMSPVTCLQVGRKWGDIGGRPIRVLRPMLAVTRQQVEEYNAAHRLPVRVDITNVDTRYLRNRIRLELLPFLEQYNPRFRQAALRSARIAAQDFDYIESQVAAAWVNIVTEQADAVAVDLDGWLALPPSPRYYLLRRAAVVLLGDAMDISTAHLAAAAEAMASKPVGTTIVWPRRLRLVKGYREFLVRIGEPRPARAITGKCRLNLPGTTTIAGTDWHVVASVGTAPCGARADRWHADLDLVATGSELYVRSRRAGDVFQPLGMRRTKKLQDFFVDEKVPRDERDAVPIVVSPSQIVWVAGYRIDDRVKVTDRTREVLCLSFVKVDGDSVGRGR